MMAIQNERSKPSPPLDQTLTLESIEGSPDRNPTDLVLLANLILGRQGNAGHKLISRNSGAQSLFKLIIKRDRPLLETVAKR